MSTTAIELAGCGTLSWTFNPCPCRKLREQILATATLPKPYLFGSKAVVISLYKMKPLYYRFVHFLPVGTASPQGNSFKVGFSKDGPVRPAPLRPLLPRQQRFLHLHVRDALLEGELRRRRQAGPIRRVHHAALLHGRQDGQVQGSDDKKCDSKVVKF